LRFEEASTFPTLADALNGLFLQQLKQQQRYIAMISHVEYCMYAIGSPGLLIFFLHILKEFMTTHTLTMIGSKAIIKTTHASTISKFQPSGLYPYSHSLWVVAHVCCIHHVLEQSFPAYKQ
jgi:hypothetical protein